MKKLKLLSSTLVMAMVSVGAYAADDNFITGGANTCTVDVLKVSDNNATANTIAVWSINEYTLNPGQYLNVTETDVAAATCPAGSYCVGGTGFTVDNAGTSIEQCPTEYPNSAAGAGAQNQCYTACTVATANLAHATAVGGNDYFDDGADTCFATDCELGYHVEGGGVEIVAQTPLIPVDYTESGSGYAYIDPNGDTGDYNADIVPEDALTSNGTWASVFDYGVVYGKASCQPASNDAAIAYVMSNYESVLGGAMTMDAFRAGLEPLAGPILTDYAVGVLSGLKDGSKTEKDMYEAVFVVFGTKKDANYQTTDTGEYCYCQMDGFSPMDGDALGAKEIVTSAPWVSANDSGSADDCASDCASLCAAGLQNGDVNFRAFRAAVFGSLGAVSAGGTCAANTINIAWDPANGGTVTENQCTYNESITLPSTPVRPGYTFTGWKLKSK